MESHLGEEIGRGGFGIIYTHMGDKSQCIKVSTKESPSQSCRQWSNEYKKINTLLERIERVPIYHKLKHVKILTPKDFVETPKSCYMIMPRIFRPEGRNVQKPTIQAQLGCPSGSMIHKGRGEFIGLEQIRSYVSEREIHNACYELGVLMGLIHHVGQNDAYDIELFLGKESGAKKCKFYVADFDLTEEIKSYDKRSLERIIWSLDAVPYFPIEDTDAILFELFKKGYSEVCQVTNVNQRIVESIFDSYG